MKLFAFAALLLVASGCATTHPLTDLALPADSSALARLAGRTAAGHVVNLGGITYPAIPVDISFGAMRGEALDALVLTRSVGRLGACATPFPARVTFEEGWVVISVDRTRSVDGRENPCQLAGQPNWVFRVRFADDRTLVTAHGERIWLAAPTAVGATRQIDGRKYSFRLFIYQ